jgi:N-acetylmuramoyl-L-alanine amidase
MAKIVIDPGHGGTTDLLCSDANHAKGPVHGTLEKTLTLDVALRVKGEIERHGGHILALTRESDINVAGADRARKARDFDADVFVSIHFNASDGHNAQGTETWVHALASNTDDSARLCRAVQAGLVRATGLSDRNRHHPPHFIKKAAFCVLNPNHHKEKTAAVLAEVSFLDRADEEERLLRDSYKDEIAIGIVDGIESYLGVRPEVELAMEDAGGEVEDAVGLQAAAAGVTVADLVGAGSWAQRAEPRAVGGYALPEEASERPAAAPRSGGYARLASAGRSPAKRMMAESLSADVRRMSAQSENDVYEFSSSPIGDAPDFSSAGDQAAAQSIVETMFAGPEADDFDFAAFETFIHSLGLNHFTPVEFLFLGASNESGTCAGRNTLPARSLWPNIANTALMLDRIRAQLGAPVRILSCYRNEAYNACISGAGGSFHKRFNAIDWRCSTGTSAEWRDVARSVRNSDSRFKGGIGFYSSFIHIDTRGVNANW